MKFNKETMDQCTKEMCLNSYWRMVYLRAPKGARERLEVAFWGTKGLDQKEDLDAYRAFRENVEKRMSYEDAAYLAKTFPEGPGKRHYCELQEKKRLADLMTPEKLNQAIDIMMSMESQENQERIGKSRTILDAKRKEGDAEFNSIVHDDMLWKAVGGDGDACCMMGDIFNHGHGVEPDPELAIFWFKRGAMCGDGDCCCDLASVCEDEDSPFFDFSQTMFWFREALRRQSQTAKWMLGYRLVNGHGIWENNRNPKLGIGLLELGLAHDHNGEAHYYLGQFYDEGLGVEKDSAKAMELYRAAAKLGHTEAQKVIDEKKGNEKEVKDEQ